MVPFLHMSIYNVSDKYRKALMTNCFPTGAIISMFIGKTLDYFQMNVGRNKENMMI